MADSTVSIIMDTTDANRNKRQKAVTNISSTATGSQLMAFANAVNALTTDTLDKVTRVEKRELSNDDTFTICGADEITCWYDSTQSEQPSTDLIYVVINERTNTIQTTTGFTSEVIGGDASKFHVVPGTFPEDGYGQLSVRQIQDATGEVKVNFAATGDFGSVSKTVTVKFFAEE